MSIVRYTNKKRVLYHYKDLPQDMMLIRMNVDNFTEAYDKLIAAGFKNNRGDATLDTKTSKAATMIGSTGLTISLIEHIK